MTKRRPVAGITVPVAIRYATITAMPATMAFTGPGNPEKTMLALMWLRDLVARSVKKETTEKV